MCEFTVRSAVLKTIQSPSIRFSVFPAEITAYGYETEPDTPLIVPPASLDDADPNTGQGDHSLGEASVSGPSLGMLALGAG